MESIKRALIGAIGGFVAVLSKILALDAQQLNTLEYMRDWASIDSLRITVFIYAPILIILGAIIGWATDEKGRMRLLAIGCAAPALIAPWTAKNIAVAENKTPTKADIGFVTNAFAQSDSLIAPSSSYWNGIKILLGIKSKNEGKYWVIVGSETEKDEALAFAKSINKEDSSIKAFVGQRQPGNEYYPIIVGGTDAYLNYSEAQALKRKAIELDTVTSSSYVSPFPDRLPAITD